ncbi:MAG: DUF882 domain-containing protein, partial [Chitinophagales bacterium]|nr:DUF882 domain-containing protein [Hyphomicrobiales bacterium]
TQGPEGEIREISLRHVWTKETLTAVYKVDGEFQPEALAKINYLLRDYRCERTIDVDLKLIDLMWELNNELGRTGPIGVVSAYRSEGYNASLLRAGRVVDPHSQHMFGRAVDVVFPGVSLQALRDAAARRGIGGVGHYPFSGPPFVHLDTGPVRRWEEMHPAQRRSLRLPMRARRRLQLNCDLKMADVLQSISETEAIAALPEGAASVLTPKLPGNDVDTSNATADIPLPTLSNSDIAQRLALAAVEKSACKPGSNQTGLALCAKAPRRVAAGRATIDKTSESSLRRLIGGAKAIKGCRSAACSSTRKAEQKSKVAARTALRRRQRVRIEKKGKIRAVVRKLSAKRSRQKSRR